MKKEYPTGYSFLVSGDRKGAYINNYPFTIFSSTSTIFSMDWTEMNSWMLWKLTPPVERLGQGSPS